MNKYVIMYNEITHGNKLMYDYETIEGKDPKDALNKHFGIDFKRLTGDSDRYSEVILIKGFYDHLTNNIVYPGKRVTQLCYGRV